MIERLKGTGVALVTPFDKDLRVDYEGLRRLVDHVSSKGVDYLVVHGSTGESATTSKKEKAEILKFIKQNNHLKLPIVLGLGGNNTGGLIEEFDLVDFEGVDAVLSVSPYYNKPSQEGIFQHFTLIADRSPVPVILYNVPGRTASNISASTTLRLAQHPNIIGIKEASGNLEQCMEIAKDKPDDFLLISGDDLLTFPIMTFGGAGVISVLANGFADIFKEIVKNTASGNHFLAKSAIFRLLDINPLMYKEGNPVGIKAVLKELNICGAEVRLPLTLASSKLQEEIRVALDKLFINQQ